MPKAAQVGREAAERALSRLGAKKGESAVMTMAVLPPPFVIPLYLRARAPGDRDPTDSDHATAADQEYVVSTLSFATVATLFAFVVVSVLYAG